MASLGVSFDSSKVEPTTPRELLPAGKYLAQIVASDIRPTRAGDGQFLSLEIEIIEGDFQRRKLWENLNLVNQNVKTVEIAQATLSAICRASGALSIEDSTELHFKPFMIDVEVRPDNRNKNVPPGQPLYPPQNRIKAWLPASEMGGAFNGAGVSSGGAVAGPVNGGGGSAAPTMTMTPQPAPAAAASGAMPWAKR